MEYCSSSDEGKGTEKGSENRLSLRERRKERKTKEKGERGWVCGGRREGGQAPSLAVVLAVVVCERREDRSV
jgi:hypothetical protein